MELRQGNSAAYTYYTKFCHLTPYLAWEGTAFRDLFYKGLRDEIKMVHCAYVLITEVSTPSQ
jgi:hypothetical protein